MEVRPLRESDDRTGFQSGDADLDRFFVKYAGQNQFRHHIGVSYVAIERGRIRGFATVSPAHFEREVLTASIRRKLPGYPLPVLRLARLAVSEAAQGRGVGTALLRHVLLLGSKMSEEYGCVGVAVDAKPDALGFYTPFGFSPLEVVLGEMESHPRPIPFFLPIDLVKAALAPRTRR